MCAHTHMHTHMIAWCTSGAWVVALSATVHLRKCKEKVHRLRAFWGHAFTLQMKQVAWYLGLLNSLETNAPLSSSNLKPSLEAVNLQRLHPPLCLRAPEFPRRAWGLQCWPGGPGEATAHAPGVSKDHCHLSGLRTTEKSRLPKGMLVFPLLGSTASFRAWNGKLCPLCYSESLSPKGCLLMSSSYAF